MQPLSNLVLPGFNAVEQDAWLDGDGLLVRAVFIELVPDLPAALTDVAALRHGLTVNTAAQGGGLIEADVVAVGGQPALRRVVKVPAPGQDHGQAFLGSFTFPKATCSTVLLVQALERGMTGFRETVILGRVGPEDYFRPHPFAPEVQAALPFHAADDPAYDAEFPHHPLTRVRQVMAQLAAQLTIDPRFAALPPFTP